MHKTSFDPIVNKDASILILGSLPGDRSIEMKEYYGHSRNRFWKVLAIIFKEEVPITYQEKKELLLKNKIAVWDVAHSALRQGSLDSEIRNEVPNDIVTLLSSYPGIKKICFNGKKAEAMFNKYFEKNDNLKYLLLPSTSPANAGCGMEKLIAEWKKILI